MALVNPHPALKVAVPMNREGRLALRPRPVSGTPQTCEREHAQDL